MNMQRKSVFVGISRISAPVKCRIIKEYVHTLEAILYTSHGRGFGPIKELGYLSG